MATDQAAPVPAGWYPDPYGASELRWWDGQNWTDSIHPPVAVAATTPPPAPPAPVQSVPAAAAEPAAAAPVVAAPVPAHEPVASPEPELPLQVPPVQSPAQVEGTAPLQSPEPLQSPPALQSPPPVEAPMSVEEFLAPPTATPAGGIPEATPPIEAPETALPSRRDLRVRSTGPSEGPLSASTATTVADPAAPKAFDWLNTGNSASSDVPQAPIAPAPSGAGIANTDTDTDTDTGAGGSTGGVTGGGTGGAIDSATPSGAVPVAASSAWAQEPRTAAASPDALYPATSSRKSTVSGWLIAAMPFIAGFLAIGAVKGAENYPRYAPAGIEWWMLAGGVLLVAYIATIILAITDRRKLDWSGFNRPAHWFWAILTAPIYLLVRTIAVKRETGRNSMMLWVWLALTAVLVGAWFAAQFFAPELIAGYTLPFL